MKKNYVSNVLPMKLLLLLLLFLPALKMQAQCPTVPVSPQVICDASLLTFGDLDTFATATANPIRWYNNPTGGTALPPSQLVGEGTYYAGDTTGNCGTREELVVDFTVGPTMQSLEAIFCSNEDPTIQSYINESLAANIPAGGTVEIFSDFRLTNRRDPSEILPENANYFIVFVDSDGCRSQVESGSTAVFVSPETPTPQTVQEFCSDTSPTIADLDPGTDGNFNWFSDVDSSNDPLPPPLPLSTPLVDGTTYFVQADNFFCDSDVTAVTVSIAQPPMPGMGTTIDFCIDDVPAEDFDLFPLLTGTPDATGTWTGPTNITNGATGTTNISALAAGTYVYEYTVPGTAPCSDETATITIVINEILTSGVPSSLNPLVFCLSDAPANFDLFTLIDNEDAGGIWTQGTSSADPVVDATFDFTTLVPGVYNFTYSQNVEPNPCPEESTTVEVTILADPNAGTAILAEICENEIIENSPFNLFDALDGSQDNNVGIWTDANGAEVSSSIDITSFTVADSPFTFTYTIDNGSCTDSEAITIAILPAPESGNFIGTPFEICEDEVAASPSFDLFTLLDGTQDANGNWFAGTDATGTAVNNPIDLTTLGTGIFNFTYSVPALGSCTDEDVTVTVIITELPEAGTPTPFILCETDRSSLSPVDLFDQLADETAGGDWADDDSTGALTGSSVDLNGLPIGTFNFTYTITSASCTTMSTVVITIEEAPEAGTGTDIEICAEDVAAGQLLDLFDQLVDNDSGGTWNDDDATGALDGNNVDLSLLPAGVYNFTYNVAALGTCPGDMETVAITINDIAAPIAADTQEFCDSATVADLLATGNNVQWYSDMALTILLSPTDALVDGDSYFATQTDASTGCESSISVTVMVTIFQTPNTGIAAPIIVCSDATMVDLFTALDGSQDTGGIWIDTDDTGALNGNIFDASAVVNGSYTFEYLIAGNPPCTDSSTITTVTVQDPVSAGMSTAIDLCTDNGTIDLFTLLGTANVGGIWSPALNSNTGVLDPLIDPSGTYTYTVMNGCNISTATVAVSITAAPNAGTDTAIMICRIDNPFDLTTQLGGTPDATGTWSPELSSGSNIFDPAVDIAGTYTYTVTAAAPCETDESAQIEIIIENTEAPTVVSSSLDFCASDVPMVMDLDAAVTGTMILWYDTIDASTPLSDDTLLVNGTIYFATQTGVTGCESDARVQVTANVADAPTPSLNIDGDLFCINDLPTLLDLTQNINEFDASSNNVVWYEDQVSTVPIPISTLLAGNTSYFAALIEPSTGCESSVRLLITPDLTACDAVEIPDGFSPNNDGVNDTFDIDNLGFLFPNFELEVYNRNGILVYRGVDSTPRFNGFSNQKALLSDGELPVGVYFYILNFNDDITRPVQGRIYISR